MRKNKVISKVRIYASYGGIAACALLLCVARAGAFTVVSISTGAPKSLEQQFISNTTSQFQATLLVNPLVANTYQLKLFGPNPMFNPPPTNKDLLDAVVTVDSYTYVYGWAAGGSYFLSQQEGAIGALGNLCDSATNYHLIQTSTGTFDRSTCQDVITTIENNLFNVIITTTPVPGF